MSEQKKQETQEEQQKKVYIATRTKTHMANARVYFNIGEDEEGNEINVQDASGKYMVVPYHDKHVTKLYQDNAKAKTAKPFVLVEFGDTDTESIFPDLSFESIWRLLVLSTYLNYTDNSNKDGYLTIGTGVNKHYMTKVEMRNVLGLTKRTFNRFLQEVCPVDSNGEIRKGYEGRPCYLYHNNQNKKWFVNNNYFRRGKLPRGVSTQTNRAFITQIRRLHNASTISQHKQLGMVVKLLPWVNRQYNFICNNPDEKCDSCIVPLTPKQIAKALGLNTHNTEKTIGGIKVLSNGNEAVYGNMYKALLNIELPIDGKKQVFCMALTTKYGTSLVVNPAFFYAGDMENELRILACNFVRPAYRTLSTNT